ncbi:hypothetical protein MMC20_000196 [Loxospora ochrophaea]|nr:hypothetical protein [Loxospora ochrophaea]
MSPQPALSISIGIELEFIVSVTDDTFTKEVLEQSEWDEATAVESAIRTAFCKHRILVNKGYYGFDAWTVKTDVSVKPSDKDLLSFDYRYYPIEVTSRILLPDEEGFREIREAVGIICGCFDHVYTNETTGFHVHLGNGQTSYPPQTVKNFSMFVTAFEEQIQSLHPSNRLNNTYCQAISDGYILRNLDSVQARVRYIEKCQTPRELVMAMNPDLDRHFAYNFQNIAPWNPPDQFKQTIECRQHAGTLDIEEIVNWTKLLVGVVRFAHGIDSPSFMRMVLRNSANRKFDILKLIGLIGLPDVRNYFKTQLGQSSKEQRWWPWRRR